METYHHVWLAVHPERTEQWLKDRLADGFHVHHVDGNHSNDDPKNLVLIEAGDHMMLHNGSSRLLWRPPSERKSPGRPRKIHPVAMAELPKQIKKTAPVSAPQSAAQIAREKRAAQARLSRAAAERLRFLADTSAL